MVRMLEKAVNDDKGPKDSPNGQTVRHDLPRIGEYS